MTLQRWQDPQRLGWLETPPDATLDQLVELTSWTFNVPQTVLSLYGPTAWFTRPMWGWTPRHWRLAVASRDTGPYQAVGLRLLNPWEQ